MSPATRLGWAIVLVSAAFAGPAGAARPRETEPASSPQGAAIYFDGQLGSRAPLEGRREGGEPMKGAQAACVNCHRRSGLGAKEARTSIPPVAGAYLFNPRPTRGAETYLPYLPTARFDREPYTDATLARAIRDGIDASGRPLSYLMPRYALDDADMAALIAQLRSLDYRRVPGVSSTELHFATIIAGDADPAKRKAVLDVLQQFFVDRNATLRGAGAQVMDASGATAYARAMFKVNRHWTLHVWELTGPASGWESQLEAHFAEQPVFAVLSGLAGRDWSPVDAFCEKRSVPCLFPNVELPPANADEHFHTLYFSRGVRLEADLIAARLVAAGGPTHVRQVYRAGDVGEAAAAALAANLEAHGVNVTSQVLAKGGAPAESVRALASGAATDAWVLWLRAPDLAVLDGTPVPQAPVYLSGLMGGLDAAPLGAAWKTAVRMAYPVDLPESRRVRVDYALGWLRMRRLPVVAEPLQADTYLACGLVSETLKHMVDAFIPDYLVERMEDMVEHRVITGYYPRLTLGPRQRFASKGGFIVHGDPADPRKLVADGPWVAP